MMEGVDKRSQFIWQHVMVYKICQHFIVTIFCQRCLGGGFWQHWLGVIREIK